MALALGLMLGCGLAMLLDWRDTRIRSADEIMALLDVPVLGVVPSMSRKETVVQRGGKVHLESNSAIAEAYRTIRTAIFFGVRRGVRSSHDSYHLARIRRWKKYSGKQSGHCHGPGRAANSYRRCRFPQAHAARNIQLTGSLALSISLKIMPLAPCRYSPD